MKRLLILLLVSLAMSWLSTAAQAAVQASHHDMAAWAGSGARSVDTCYPCHGYQETGTGNATLGKIGSMCYNRCHVGGAVAGTMPLASATNIPQAGQINTTDNQAISLSYTATIIGKYNSGHTMATRTPPAPDPAIPSALGFPYTQGSGTMECTSCHDVHENRYTPFIRAPLSDNSGSGVVGTANVFCHTCHGATTNGAARWNDMSTGSTGIVNGSHPSEVNWGGAGTRSSYGRRGRAITFRDTVASDNHAIFRSRTPSGTALNSPSATYVPGGKLGDWGQNQTGNVGCYTCHATHIPSSAGMPNLLVMNYRGFRGGTQYALSELCAGCHYNATAGWGANANPGVTQFFHPTQNDTMTSVRGTPVTNPGTNTASYMVSTGAFRIVVGMAGVDNGVNGQVLCSSCHTGSATRGNNAGVHYGPADGMLLNPNRTTCTSCHAANIAIQNTTETLGTSQHHVYGGTTNYNTDTRQYPQYVYFNATDNANLTNGLSCEDCHIFNGTAHNWN